MRKLLLIGCSLLTLASCASSNVAPAYRYGAKAGVGSLGVHTVQRGDTVWTVSQKYNLDLRGIIEANNLSPPYALKTGARLNLPAPQTYTVKSDDSLYSISRAFNTSQTALTTLNKLAPPYKIPSGRILKIPHNYDAPEPVPVFAQNSVVPNTVQKGTALPPANVEMVQLPDNQMPPQPDAHVNETMSASSAVTPSAPLAAPSNPEPVPARSGKFLKPVSGNIISAYGTKADGQHNDGINIQAMRGDAVRAAENGTVAYVGNEIEGYGNMILLRHEDQYVTAYAHLAKTLVKKGDVIRRGQTIGTVGSTGFVDKPQLHFEIRKGNKAVDPADLI